MVGYRLTRQADADLVSIIRYTLDTWGDEQTEKYVARLEACFVEIANQRVVAKSFSKSFPELHVVRCQHHFVFYLEHSRAPASIVAILHERMDMLSRLTDRLEG
ncbi:type II toxin-antitoxin system RelE/ParE family toxin [Cerasicoccus fimbriatus]|uniref:type II toxin-antitoxin system RelE/ParE family toxin n=1 Tax=Cerasicoccus fimbriatus TaxID=3014554 RepID=UPI0022B5BF5F|nr:type II toxin-antitoxin system RelE/ParE family toxin [Cerasicoccus sp. TK19100]